jgi:NADH-quinone oxidoreductase subunit C/D
MENLKEKIKAIAPSAMFEENTQVLTVDVDKNELRQLAENLKNDESLAFDYLQDIIGLDLGDALGTNYRLFSTKNNNQALVVKTKTEDRENPALQSVSDLWQSANLYEREVYDFLGIKFIGHPDLRRLFLRPDWKGYPLRKDYDIESNPITLKNESVEEFEGSEKL